MAERLNGRKISDETLQPGRQGTRRGDTDPAAQAGIGIDVLTLWVWYVCRRRNLLCKCRQCGCFLGIDFGVSICVDAIVRFRWLCLSGFDLCLLLLLMLPLLEDPVLL